MVYTCFFSWFSLFRVKNAKFRLLEQIKGRTSEVVDLAVFKFSLGIEFKLQSAFSPLLTRPDKIILPRGRNPL